MKLKELRAYNRKTQWDLVLLTGINQSKISLLEQGYMKPTEEEKKKIANALSVDVNEIEWSGEND